MKKVSCGPLEPARSSHNNMPSANTRGLLRLAHTTPACHLPTFVFVPADEQYGYEFGAEAEVDYDQLSYEVRCGPAMFISTARLLLLLLLAGLKVHQCLTHLDHANKWWVQVAQLMRTWTHVCLCVC